VVYDNQLDASAGETPLEGTAINAGNIFWMFSIEICRFCTASRSRNASLAVVHTAKN
jgi:hypothetical protein